MHTVTYIFDYEKFIKSKDIDNDIILPEFKHYLLRFLGRFFDLKYFIYKKPDHIFTGRSLRKELEGQNLEYLKIIKVNEIDSRTLKISNKITDFLSTLIDLDLDTEFKNNKRLSRELAKKSREKRKSDGEKILNFVKSFKEGADQLSAVNGALNYLHNDQPHNIVLINELKSYAISIINHEEYEKKRKQLDNLDLGNTKATQKIIYLMELGVLDFLREKEPFNLSTNALATVLSAVTGEKTETLQSYLNPIINTNSGQKNNPLNNDKNVEKVKQTLINIGFKLS